jgi:hypothetical protein
MAKMKFKGTRIAVRPDTPAVGKNNESRGGRGILERQEYLYPARARIMLTRSVSEACKPFPRLRFGLVCWSCKPAESGGSILHQRRVYDLALDGYGPQLKL